MGGNVAKPQGSSGLTNWKPPQTSAVGGRGYEGQPSAPAFDNRYQNNPSVPQNNGIGMGGSLNGSHNYEWHGGGGGWIPGVNRPNNYPSGNGAGGMGWNPGTNNGGMAPGTPFAPQAPGLGPNSPFSPHQIGGNRPMDGFNAPPISRGPISGPIKDHPIGGYGPITNPGGGMSAMDRFRQMMASGNYNNTFGR